MSENKQPNIETIKTLQDAWLKGDLQYQRSLTYLKKPADLGCIIYLVLYEQSDKVVYQGAFQMKLSLEEKLISKDQLTAYITYRLASELE
jgi:hypothetical protein